MISRILVPLDGSELGEGVLPSVEALAGQLHAEVVLVEVVEVEPNVQPTAAELAHLASSLSDGEARGVKTAENYLSGVATALQAKAVNARWEVVKGVPAASIINFARSHDIDLIAISTHGRSGLSRLISGSVAGQVVREAGIPMLLVRPGHEST